MCTTTAQQILPVLSLVKSTLVGGKDGLEVLMLAALTEDPTKFRVGHCGPVSAFQVATDVSKPSTSVLHCLAACEVPFFLWRESLC